MDRELSAIRLSAGANAFFGVLGTAFGVWLGSDAILLDGIFNWISLGLALLSIRVARLLRQPESELFPFGYAAFEPFLNTVKALLVLGVCALAFAGSLNSLFSGGRELDAGWALVYAAVATLGCFLVATVQRGVTRKVDSPLVAADARNWMVNGAVSAAVALAFGLALLMQGTSAAHLVPYVDPVLVLVLVLATLVVPVRMALNGIAELLAVRPPSGVQAEITHRFCEKARDRIERFELRINRVGRTIFVVADAFVDPARRADELETLRQDLTAHMREAYPHLVMAVVFRPSAPD